MVMSLEIGEVCFCNYAGDDGVAVAAVATIDDDL